MIDTDDRKNQICTECGAGYYTETSIHDDWDGVLHCTNKKCNHEVKRYKSDDSPAPKPEKVKLSPAAQAVLDAAINVAESPDAEVIVAAALRAVSEHGEFVILDDSGDGDFVVKVDLLRAIANQLEAK